MANTNEELQKLTEKQFSSVTKQELNVYDTAKKLFDAFTKEAKALEAQYKKDIKALDQEDKALDKTLQSNLDKQTKEHQTVLQKLDTQKQQAMDLSEQEIKKHTTELEKAISDNEKQLATLEKQHQKALADLEKELHKNIEASNKSIASLDEKSVKDQATFDQKITDLKAKYEAKIESILEKEQTKLTKLQETFDNKVQSIQQAIQKEQDKRDKKLATKQAVYEEELAEIDEKIEFDKTEFERKHLSIKDSADKRIQVREKHLQRAISENDNRSAKQHKKDIAKFRKEADKDLVVLEKNYANQQKESADYRKNFIEDYVNDVSDIHKDFAKDREDKQLDIDKLQVAHTNDTEQVKLDFEQQRADELNKFNNSFAQIREKQEQVLKEKDLNVEKEKQQQEIFNIEYNQQKDTLIEEQKLAVEDLEKAKKLHEFNHEKLVQLSINHKDETIRRLNNEADLAEVGFTHNKTVLNLETNKEHHKVQDKRHRAIRDEYTTYQEHLAPLYTKRVDALLAYEQAEINNRLSLKLAVYESTIKELVKTYKVLEDKVEAECTLEASFYEEKITELAGEKQEAYTAYVDTTEKELLELKAKIDTLQSYQNRKEKKDLEGIYHQKHQAFVDEKGKQERELETLVGPYKQALQDVQDRKEKAVKDYRELHQAATSEINDNLTLLKEHSAAELALAKTNLEHIKSALNQFGLQIASRREQQTSAHKTYLDQQLKIEDANILSANKLQESSRELLVNQLETDLQELKQQEQVFLQEVTAKVQAEESRVEEVKQVVLDAIEQHKSKANQAIAQANDRFTSVKNDLDQQYNEEFNQINTTLQTQVADYNQVTADVKKKKQASTALLESEQKRVKKECDLRLKEDFSKIDTDHKELLQTLIQ